MPDSPSSPTEQPQDNQKLIAGTIAPPPVEPAAAESAPPGKAGHSRRRRVWVWLCVLLVVVLGAYFLWSLFANAKAKSAAAKAAAKGPAPIPVVAAKSRKGDIGVYYSGLGAVTPLATVTVKTRVDGQLMNVRYREGDTVHKGDLLVEI